MEKEVINADATPGGDAGMESSEADAALANMDISSLGEPQPEGDKPKAEAPAEEPPPQQSGGETATEGSGDEGIEEEMEVYGSEKELLEARNVKGHDSIADYINAQDQALQDITSTLRALGMDTKATNLQELRDEILAGAVEQERGGGPAPTPADTGTPPGDAPPAVNMDGFMKKYGDRMEDGADGFYKDFANAVAAHAADMVKTSLGDVTSRLDRMTGSVDAQLDMMWYNEAKAQAGDAPIPPFPQAQALLNSQPDLRETARIMLVKFGQSGHNPMTKVFERWGASRTPSGVTPAQAASADKAAKKVAIHKSLLSATPATRTKEKAFEDLSPDQREERLGKMKIPAE